MRKELDYDRINRHENFQKWIIPKIQPLIKNIQYKMKTGQEVEIFMSKHGRYRENSRNISYRVIKEIIREGKVIEYQGQHNKRDEVEGCPDSGESCHNLILHKKVVIDDDAEESNKDKGRDIHVCVNIQGESILVKTVYFPDEHSEKWNKDFTKRVFYKKDNRI